MLILKLDSKKCVSDITVSMKKGHIIVDFMYLEAQ